jgi:hypothetical protein
MRPVIRSLQPPLFDEGNKKYTLNLCCFNSTEFTYLELEVQIASNKKVVNGKFSSIKFWSKKDMVKKGVGWIAFDFHNDCCRPV